MARPAKLPEKRPGKVGGKRDQNRKQRAEQLSRAALELFLERGIEAVTIDEIAERAGTAKGNFYRYFDDKAALVSSLLVPLATQVRTGMRKCAVDLARATSGEAVKEAYGRLALVLAMAAIDHRDVVRLYLQEHRAPATESRAALSKLARDLDEGAFKLSESAVRHGVVSVDDPRISALAVVGAVEHLALVILRQEVELSVAEVSTTLIRMVLDGLRPRDPA
jgi:AcrR family transcriptional regulator